MTVRMNEKKSPFAELTQLGNEALNLLKTASRAAQSSDAIEKARGFVAEGVHEVERAMLNVKSAAEAEWKKASGKTNPPNAPGPQEPSAQDEATDERDLGGGI
jgi:hypothetical protein